MQRVFIAIPSKSGYFFAAEAEAFQEELPDKPVTMAIREVANGELSASVKEEYKK